MATGKYMYHKWEINKVKHTKVHLSNYSLTSAINYHKVAGMARKQNH